jgi:deferrochelatase/peroxidase EfeB
MTAPHRSRALGDVGADAPERWRWGGPATPPVDLLLLLYAEDRAGLSALERRLTDPGAGLELVRALDTRWSDREHFGFGDGIAQPRVAALREGRPDDTIRAGEFVLGYRNEHDQLTDRPLVARASDPAEILPVDPAGGDADLRRNGSYLVLRTLSQGVRDTLDPHPGSERSIALDKLHRLLRRGRGYGAPIGPDAALNGGAPDDEERGLHFVCLCANIARQFEFVQHTWLNNPKFNGLYDDPDPLLGPAGRQLTVQGRPVNRRVTELPPFVGVRGGGYFFLPGVRAVRYLASLAAA